MSPGSPCQLRPDTPLVTVLRLAAPGETLGVWVRMAGPAVELAGFYRVGRNRLLLSGDLGLLLRRTSRVALRAEERVVVAPSERLIEWRALRVVLGAPYLPLPPQLRALFPELRLRGATISLPLGLGSAEEALAIFAAEGVPVAATRIEYLPH
ncbi:MAG: hypothetical protein ACREMX_03065 [Gemmatimonadales bacterium]